MEPTRRDFVVGAAAALLAGAGRTAPPARPNVLFIAIDDLRPALGCYGVAQARTPHLDAFARRGLTFNHHYVQVPTCGASRYALLTGRRPSSPAALSNNAFIQGATALPAEADPPAARTMPELFRRNGYHTTVIGKISHQPDGRVFAYNGSGDGRPELPDAWDEYATPYGPWQRGWGAFFAYAGGRHREDGSGYAPVAEFPDCGDEELPDGLLATAAIETLRQRSGAGQPFFLGLGFYKPHLPFVAPLRYRQPFDGVALPSVNGLTRGDTHYWHNSGEFFRYQMPFTASDRTLTEAQAQEIRRAYYAAVSYSDAQVGRVLDELARLKLADDTIVVVWGDHGWHLGDHNIWGKHSPLETALRSALILSVPGMATAGQRTDATVETLDLYPTLRELCGLQGETRWPLDGTSLAPVLADSHHPGKTAARSYWRDATSIHAGQHRLIVAGPSEAPTTIELYDHRSDPDELHNVAEQQPEMVRELLRLR